MAKEIERKFLLSEGGVWFSTSNLESICTRDNLRTRILEQGSPIEQGYLPATQGTQLAQELDIVLLFTAAEYRLRDHAGTYSFTIKDDKGLEREEVKRKIKPEQFKDFWKHTQGARISKTRLNIPYLEKQVELDVYRDRPDLIVAEVEFESQEDALAFQPLGKEVTEVKRYKNRNLAL